MCIRDSYKGSFELSCVLRTEEQSTLVADPVHASRPRVIRYLATNIDQASDAKLGANTAGVLLKTVGETIDSYRGLLADIERRDREYPIVLVSPTADGEYLVDPDLLQDDLIGIGQVVRIAEGFNSYDMEGILGRHWSAWSGAINVLAIPTPTGFVRGRLLLSDSIEGWGESQFLRRSELLAWVTSNTNISRLRKRIRPEGVIQLALRRRLQIARSRSDQMTAEQLREELERASRFEAEQAEWITELENENARLEEDAVRLRDVAQDAQDDAARLKFDIESLKDQLGKSGQGRASSADFELLLGLASRSDPPQPFECLRVIESVHGDKCVVLKTAHKSAKEMNRFLFGRQLLDMLIRLVVEYRRKLMEGGDSKARLVFGQGEYAAKESETVMSNKAMRRARTFEYKGSAVEMFRHLKIGVDDDRTKTIRVHFYWDADDEKIVIGYCGEHLPVKSY
jgi:hypothetical protein